MKFFSVCLLWSTIVVVDGDTVKIRKPAPNHAQHTSYRLLGIDTPEIKFAKCERERKLGLAAKDALRELINAGKGRDSECVLKMETVLHRRDKYGRSLGRLLVNDTDVAKVLIWARLGRYYSGKEKRRSWCGEADLREY